MKPREFVVGDLVLRKAVGSIKEPGLGILALNKKEPYRVTLVVRIGAYYLEDMDERPLPRP